MLALAQAVVIGAQLAYWLLIRDDGRDEVVWRACVTPGQ